MALHPAHRHANKQSNSDAACRRPHKPPRRIRRRESAGNEGGNRKLQRNQRSGIIHQTLALEDHLYAMRNAEPANDRRRRNRIWRGDNCAEGKSSRPWKRRHNGMRDPRNCERCCQHQPDGEQEYRPQISPEITPRREQRSRINQRRKNEVEHNVRIQVHRRQSRHETQSESAKDEHDRIRQRNLVRQHGQDPDGRQQKDNNLGLVHESADCCSRGAVTPARTKNHAPISDAQRPRLLLWPARGSPEAPRDVFPTNDKVPAAARSTCVPAS